MINIQPLSMTNNEKEVNKNNENEVNIQPSHPLFVIRNSSNSSNDRLNVNDVYSDKQDEENQLSDDESDHPENHNLPSSIVQLVEAPQGMYMLDFCHTNDSFMASFLAENQITKSGDHASSSGDRTYVDGRAWRHLHAYSVLVGKPIEKSSVNDEKLKLNLQLSTALDNHEGSFVLLQDTLEDIIHTLLPIEILFSWETLVDARKQGKLSWKEIRRYLFEVRRKVPFLTQEGLLRSVVNTHLTFHQFAAFSRLVEWHLDSVASISSVVVPDISICDIFPSFHSMTPEDQKIELLASVKDKLIRTQARESGLAIPANADHLVSTTECTDEWRLYMQWWCSSDQTRTDFCMRELLFVEKNDEARRNAEKDGISMRGRHSKDPNLREQFLRRFGAWYLGISREDDLVADEATEDEAQPLNKPSLYTYDFSTGQNCTNPIDLARSSPLKLPNFNNKAWKPSSAAELDGEQINEHDDSSMPPSQFIIIKSAAATAVEECSPPPSANTYSSTISKDSSIVLDMPRVEGSLQENETIRLDEMPTSATISKMATSFIIGSKIKPTEKPISFRREFLKNLTSNIDNVASMLNRKAGSNLRGIELFRSKVRLVMLLQKFSPGKSLQQFEAATPHLVDIFHFDAKCNARAPPVKPKKQEEVKRDGRLEQEKFIRAKLHHQHALCKNSFRRMVSWTRQMAKEKQKKGEQEQKMKDLKEKAMAAYERCLRSRFFQAMRDHTMLLKNERAKAEIPPPEPVPEVVQVTTEQDEMLSSVACPPSESVERKYFALEDTRSHTFRSHCHKMLSLDSLSLFDELDCMKLEVGRNRQPSGLDVVCQDEYNTYFANAINLRSTPTSSVVKGDGIMLLDKDALETMKREKLAGASGASNLFDVPPEFIVTSPPEDNFDVEYRAREKVRGIANQSM